MSVYFKEKPEFLDLSLKSIMEKQTLKPSEFIIVCDGPLTEELDEVINKYEKAYPAVLKVNRLEKNGGLGKALNYGLEKCTNELIARADSDDVCREDRFEKQVYYMLAHPELAALGTDILEFDSDPDVVKNYKKMPADNDAVYKMCLFRNPVNHMTVMFRKSAVEKVGSYIHLQYIEDYYLWVRLFTAGYQIENLNEPLVHARVGSGMVKRRGSKAYIKSWKTMNKFMKEKGMIGTMKYIRNMISVVAFVYMPVGLKEWIYKNVLRKK